MADISDVENAIVSMLAQALYPNGTAQPSAANVPVKVYPGWPTASMLDADLLALSNGTGGKLHVSVFPAGQERNVTRYVPKAITISTVQPTLALSIAGGGVLNQFVLNYGTLDGPILMVGGVMPSPFSPHNMAVIIGGVPFIYPVQPADTLASIATGLASLISATYPGAVSSGNGVLLPPNVVPSAVRVGTTSVVGTEWERQQQRMQITVWSNTPQSRTAVSVVIKSELAKIAFLMMPDGFGARIKSVGGLTSDALQKANLYRRDFFYEVEYATTETETAYQVVAIQPIQIQSQIGA